MSRPFGAEPEPFLEGRDASPRAWYPVRQTPVPGAPDTGRSHVVIAGTRDPMGNGIKVAVSSAHSAWLRRCVCCKYSMVPCVLSGQGRGRAFSDRPLGAAENP